MASWEQLIKVGSSGKCLLYMCYSPHHEMSLWRRGSHILFIWNCCLHSLDREGIQVLDQQLQKVKQEIQHSIFLLKSYSKSQCDSFADNLPGYWLPVQVESISLNFTIFSKYLHPPCVRHIGDRSNKTNNVFAGHKYWLFLSKVGNQFSLSKLQLYYSKWWCRCGQYCIGCLCCNYCDIRYM